MGYNAPMADVDDQREGREWLPRPLPGEIMATKLLAPLGLSQTALAKAIGVPPRRINEIVLGKRAITADTDLRLGRYFGVEAGFFLRLQTDYDLYVQRRKIEVQLALIVPRGKAVG
ncbi:MAG: higA [Caulobacteraceae bacterium]|nr:higA [Caulobacteraceae bacterium]